MDRHDHDGTPRRWQGLPQTRNSAITPIGELEQVSKMVDGLGYHREGWRRVVFRAGIALLVLAAVALASAWIYAGLSA